ncbi:MAG TPA: hypothetical protein VGQ68_09125 [Gaiellaceae bacterium]|jgi:hypothetical protein|nr:hypothetical protein [Gaiellaceae bacterium]
MAEPLTEAEVKEFVTDWYLKLDVHAPADEIMPMVAEADEGLEMKFPEATVRTPDEFKGMLDTWYHRFFDEVHTMKELDISTGDDKADVKLCVNWQAKIWDPPDPKSKWLGFDAYQTWVVKRSQASGKPVIATYIVDDLDPMPGSTIL